MNVSPPARAAASVLAVAAITGVVFALRPVAPVLSLGVLYVFAVLPVAVLWGLAYALPVSILSMLAFNFFFLPPEHTLALRDSENWVALAVYLVTGVVAGELAARAGVSPQTASNHLAKLIAGRMLRVEQQGRWRYYRLAGAEVGHAVEALAVLAPPMPGQFGSAEMNGEARRLRDASTCYSHLAGRLGVALADALVAEHWMEEDGRSYRLTPTGTRSLRALGIEARGRPAQPIARRCLDWTERRPHVAGPVGTALASLAFDRGWVRRMRGTRAVMLTPVGRAQLKKVFNVRWEERTL